MNVWKHKDLISLSGLSAEELWFLLGAAKAFKGLRGDRVNSVPTLQGKALVNFFVEPSTRTRISFELAALRLGANVINVSATMSSLQKGETLKDTALSLEALHADMIVLRHGSAGAAQLLAKYLRSSSVINAGDGAHEHPTQGLLDGFTIWEKHGRLEDLRVAIVGDILFSRVARSNIHLLVKLGAKVTLVGPSTLVPREFEAMGVRITHRMEDILETTDVLSLLRIQYERQCREYFPSVKEYISLFGLTKQRAARLKSSCLVMHPGPVKRGIEVDSEVADGAKSVILEQVANGLAVRTAVLYACGGGSAEYRGKKLMKQSGLMLTGL
ncbi:MAG: aspartate carbamoyltransferase catalytic subunit [Candidatus Xiphinematobacter sp.]|nr:MAG: aspartate carbamoyltransferase catalytic subunit [Candidatus Xiphinematobacter sp.]